MADETVEISKSDLAILQNAHKLLGDLWDGKTGMDFKKMVKAARPDTKIPELETIEAVTKPYDEKITHLTENNKKLEERLDKWEEDQKNRSEESELSSTLHDVKKKYSLTDEGMDKVIARMKEKSNPDAEAAAAWVRDQLPKTKPVNNSNYTPQSFNLYGSSEKDEKWEALNKDPIKFFDNEVATILNEFANAEAA